VARGMAKPKVRERDGDDFSHCFVVFSGSPPGYNPEFAPPPDSEWDRSTNRNSWRDRGENRRIHVLHDGPSFPRQHCSTGRWLFEGRCCPSAHWSMPTATTSRAARYRLLVRRVRVPYHVAHRVEAHHRVHPASVEQHDIAAPESNVWRRNARCRQP